MAKDPTPNNVILTGDTYHTPYLFLRETYITNDSNKVIVIFQRTTNLRAMNKFTSGLLD